MLRKLMQGPLSDDEAMLYYGLGIDVSDMPTTSIAIAHNPNPAPKLPADAQAQIIAKSEDLAAKRLTAGVHSLFWQSAKFAYQTLPASRIVALPDKLQDVIESAKTFLR